MASQIIFFNKSAADFSNPNVSATASQGSAYASKALNRDMFTAWITTGSVDADNTTYEVDFVDQRTITDIILNKMNFKSYTIKYWSGSAWVDFATPVDIANNTQTTRRHQVQSVDTKKLQIMIRGTMVPNSDKYMYQVIATTLLGQLAGWPVIDDPTHDQNKKNTLMLSGKRNIVSNVGGFSTTLKVREWRNAADLALMQTLFAMNRGFLVWLCGGDETQFFTPLKGYRLEDIPLMRCADDWRPQWADGMYARGVEFKMKLVEVID
jgi:hypothetical protein